MKQSSSDNLHSDNVFKNLSPKAIRKIKGSLPRGSKILRAWEDINTKNKFLLRKERLYVEYELRGVAWVANFPCYFLGGKLNEST